MHCGATPCGMTTGGCTNPMCPMGRYQHTILPLPSGTPESWSRPLMPMGCICPPTSEKTWENPACPRKNPFAAGAPTHGPEY